MYAQYILWPSSKLLPPQFDDCPGSTQAAPLRQPRTPYCGTDGVQCLCKRWYEHLSPGSMDGVRTANHRSRLSLSTVHYDFQCRLQPKPKRRPKWLIPRRRRTCSACKSIQGLSHGLTNYPEGQTEEIGERELHRAHVAYDLSNKRIVVQKGGD